MVRARCGCGGGGRISRRAVARLVFPDEVGPERARRIGGGGGGVVVVVVVGCELLGGGGGGGGRVEGEGVAGARAGMVWFGWSGRF